MQTLSIDIETYCELDLIKVGVYRYASHESFEILMIAYAIDDEKVEIIDLTKEDVDLHDFVMKLMDPSLKKSAFNANFERTCLASYFEMDLPVEQWSCTMVHAMTLGLPRSLKAVGEVLKLTDQKLDTGKSLITYFSKPCKPTKKNEGRTRNLPRYAPEKYEEFMTYCIRDVEVERTLRKKLAAFPMDRKEVYFWEKDQVIVDRGVKLDRAFVKKAIECDELYRKRLEEQVKEITGIDNPNSLAQLKKWITEMSGVDAVSLGLTKKTIPLIIEECDNPDVIKVLEIRQELGKTSTSKYSKMMEVINDDDRARGLMQFYGANRTGRWAGRLIQVQNLPQNKIPDLAEARSLVKGGFFKGFEMLYENVPGILSQLIRTAFVPEDGKIFYVCDYSAIEARVIAWMAGEKWRMDVFNSHGKIYEASASQMFKVPIEEITKGSPLRQKGKIAELALGYGGSVGALKSMGALDMGLEEDELKPLVNAWRKANPKIVQFWWDVGNAAMKCVKDNIATETHGLKFIVEKGILFITLPSGRRLAYVKPRIEIDSQYGRDKLTYEGFNQTKGKWERIDTYGPKLVENIIQGISRDCLARAMVSLENAGFEIVMHVHDEVVIEAPRVDVEGTMKDIQELMSDVKWAEGLPLTADGYTCEFYMKD